MDREKYVTLDKASRANPFAMTAEFRQLTQEWDNGLRNASHHGGMSELEDGGRVVIRYRAGKGGQGQVQTISRPTYAAKCMKMFAQLSALLQLEISLTQALGRSIPV